MIPPSISGRRIIHGARGATDPGQEKPGSGERGGPVDKPGSVVGNHSSGTRVTAGPQATYPDPARATPWDPYLVLLRVGFTVPPLLPAARCALTAPFHPYSKSLKRYIFCCTFHRLTPSRCYLASFPLEPGLSSEIQRLPGQLQAGLLIMVHKKTRLLVLNLKCSIINLGLTNTSHLGSYLNSFFK